MDWRAQWAKDVGKTVKDAVAKCADPILEPKYDGWRIIVEVCEDGVRLYKPMRNSDPAKRYEHQLPELCEQLRHLPVGTILDGELVALRYDPDTTRYINEFFRIHTCMRSNDIKKVAPMRKGIQFIAFDCPMPDIAGRPLPERRKRIQSLLEINKRLVPDVDITIQMPATQENHDGLCALGFEGSVIKDQSKPYAFGKRGHGMFKIKTTTTIDCIVMEVVMDGQGQHLGKAGRMVVGQMKDGVLTPVCSVNCLNNKHRDEATANPGKQVGRVLEVKIYGWTTEGPRHPTPMRFRDGDKLPQECVWSRV